MCSLRVPATLAFSGYERNTSIYVRGLQLLVVLYNTSKLRETQRDVLLNSKQVPAVVAFSSRSTQTCYLRNLSRTFQSQILSHLKDGILSCLGASYSNLMMKNWEILFRKVIAVVLIKSTTKDPDEKAKNKKATQNQQQKRNDNEVYFVPGVGPDRKSVV